jgi:hypothetical protein
MWKVLAKSVQGSGHKRLETVCQDACLTSLFESGLESAGAAQPVLVLAVADGAGSADHSDIGAQIACRVIHEAIAEHLQRPDWAPVSREQAIAWYECVRIELEREAESLSVPSRQLACTLLVAMISENAAAFCQIGDGAHVIRDQEVLRPVFWPQSGEYANTTNFVTSPRIERDLMFEWREERIDDVALFTDGLQALALNYATKQAHQPFFTPLLDALRNHPDPMELEGPMQAFLESKNLSERTDDDLTLILATRIHPHDPSV